MAKRKNEQITKEQLEAILDDRISQSERNFGALIEEQNDKIQIISETVLGMNEKMDRREKEYDEYKQKQDQINNATWFRFKRLENRIFDEGDSEK